MKKILFVLENYFNPSAQNANCVRSIVKELETANEVDSYFLSIEYETNNIYLKADNHSSFIVSRTRTSFFKDIIRKITKFFFMPVENKKVVKKLEREIEKMNELNSFDLIIAVQNPCEATEAVALFKKKNEKTHCALYEIDPASNRYKIPNSFFEKIWSDRTRKWELKMYNNFDYLVHMETHRKHFSDQFYVKFFSKTYYSDIPSFLCRYPQSISSQKNNKKTFIYAGAFYPKLREPYYMINVFKKLVSGREMNIDIYSGKTMRSECLKHIGGNSQIRIMDYVDEKTLSSLICSSDFLLSVGNTDSDFLPSKVLFYMGFGKPIIHFAHDHNDTAIPYLLKYENSLIIFESDSFEDNCKAVDDFISSGMIVVNLEMLQSVFLKNTPGFTANLFKAFLNEK